VVARSGPAKTKFNLVTSKFNLVKSKSGFVPSKSNLSASKTRLERQNPLKNAEKPHLSLKAYYFAAFSSLLADPTVSSQTKPFRRASFYSIC
jgi:hypothetical protein